MNEILHISEVLEVIEQTLHTYRQDKDRVRSLTEHVHRQSAIDALLILKTQLKMRARQHQ